MIQLGALSFSGVSKLALTIAQNQLRKNGERGTMELLTKRGLLIEYDLARGYGLSLEQTLFIRAFIECGGAKEAAERLGYPARIAADVAERLLTGGVLGFMADHHLANMPDYLEGVLEPYANKPPESGRG